MRKGPISQEDVIYFVLTDRFCNGDPNNDAPSDINNPQKFHGGDFKGLVSKIPYLKNLGITAIWITPVYLNITDLGDSAGYHGYWAIDFNKLDPHLYSANANYSEGSKKYLKDLVDTFHDNGIKVMLDMVVNHTGYHTADFNEKASDELKMFPYNHGTGTVKEPLCGLPDLNHDDSDVADYFIQNIIDWITETGIDAIRMDTVKHVEDKFWYFFKSYIKTSHPEITLLGEVLVWDADSISKYQREHDFDTLFDFPLCGAIMGSLIWDKPMTDIARPRISDAETPGILDLDNKSYSNANRLVTLLDNHDLSRRIMTEIYEKVGHWDRLLATKILKYCLTFLLTTRGIPQIYYGTEIGMEGYKDPDNRRDMPWQLFENDAPRDTNSSESAIFTHLKALIALRKESKALQSGYLFTLYADHYIYAYLREYRGDVKIIIMNNGHSDMEYPLPIHIHDNGNIPNRIRRKEATVINGIEASKGLLSNGTQLTDLIGGCDAVNVVDGVIHVQVPGKTAAVYSL